MPPKESIFETFWFHFQLRNFLSQKEKKKKSMQPENFELYRFLAENGVGSYGGFPSGSEFPAMQSFSSSSTYYPLEMSGVTTETTPHDKALAALKNHKEAEKRRRERINSHLNRLRALLPCNSKVIYILNYF